MNEPTLTPGGLPRTRMRRVVGLVALGLLTFVVLTWIDRLPLVVERIRGLIDFFRTQQSPERLFGAMGWLLALTVIGIAALATLRALYPLVSAGVRLFWPGQPPAGLGDIGDSFQRHRLLRFQEVLVPPSAKPLRPTDIPGMSGRISWKQPEIFRRTPGLMLELASEYGLLVTRAIGGLVTVLLLDAVLPPVLSRAFWQTVRPPFPWALVFAFSLPLIGIVLLLYWASRDPARATVAEKHIQFPFFGNPAGLFHIAPTFVHQVVGESTPIAVVDERRPDLRIMRAGESGQFAGGLVFETRPQPRNGLGQLLAVIVLLAGATSFGFGLYFAVQIPFYSSIVPAQNAAMLLDLVQRGIAAVLFWGAGMRLFQHGDRLMGRHLCTSLLCEVVAEGTWSARVAGGQDTDRQAAIEVRADVHLAVRATRAVSEWTEGKLSRTIVSSDCPQDVADIAQLLAEQLSHWRGAAGGGEIDRPRPSHCPACGAACADDRSTCRHCGTPL